MSAVVYFFFALQDLLLVFSAPGSTICQETTNHRAWKRSSSFGRRGHLRRRSRQRRREVSALSTAQYDMFANIVIRRRPFSRTASTANAMALPLASGKLLFSETARVCIISSPSQFARRIYIPSFVIIPWTADIMIALVLELDCSSGRCDTNRPRIWALEVVALPLRPEHLLHTAARDSKVCAQRSAAVLVPGRGKRAPLIRLRVTVGGFGVQFDGCGGPRSAATAENIDIDVRRADKCPLPSVNRTLSATTFLWKRSR
ncbi:hypothetical protein BKA93DRAFT_879916 [Sparassis latifolia]